jgi:hypothetical protein
MSQGSRRIDNEIEKSSRRLQSCTHVIQDSNVSTSSRERQKQVIVTSLLRIHSRGGGIRYLHSCSRLKCTCVLMLMIWCNHNAHGMVQGDAVMQCRQLLES